MRNEHTRTLAGTAVKVVSLPDDQDVTSAFDVSVATGNGPGDTLVLVERGSALVAAGRYRFVPAVPVCPAWTALRRQ